MSFPLLICVTDKSCLLALFVTLHSIWPGWHSSQFQQACSASLYWVQCPPQHLYSCHCNFCDHVWLQFFCLFLFKSSKALLLVSPSTICIKELSQAQPSRSLIASTSLCNPADGRWLKPSTVRKVCMQKNPASSTVFSDRKSVTDTKTLSLTSSLLWSPISWDLCSQGASHDIWPPLFFLNSRYISMTAFQTPPQASVTPVKSEFSD